MAGEGRERGGRAIVVPLDAGTRAALCEEAALRIEGAPAFAMAHTAWARPEAGAMLHTEAMRQWTRLGRSRSGYPDDGQPACVAGTLAAAVHGDRWVERRPAWLVRRRAREILGLPLHLAHRILAPDGRDGEEAGRRAGAAPWEEGWVDAGTAAAMLRRHGATGEIVWT